MSAIAPTAPDQRGAQSSSLATFADHPETITIEEACSRLGIGRTLGYALARDGRFPVRVIRAGRRLLVPTAALDRLLSGEPTQVA